MGTEGPNFDGARPQASPPQQAPRLRRGRIAAWAVALVVLVAAGVLFWLRPSFDGSGCHPGGRVDVIGVPLRLCVDPAVWGPIVTTEPGKTSFGAGAEKIYFDSFGQRDVIPPERLSTLILRYSKQFATNNEDLSEVAERTATVAGRPWHVLQFASETADLVVYYYSAEGFGSAELFFMSFKPDVARRDALAAPILESVRFTAPEAAASVRRPGSGS
jgi:hypothetical protein